MGAHGKEPHLLLEGFLQSTEFEICGWLLAI